MVVLDGVARLQHPGALEPGNGGAAAPPAPRAAARSRCRWGRPCRRRGPRARGRSGAARGRRSAPPCPRSTGSSARRWPRSGPEYIGARCRLARISACVARRRVGDPAVDLRVRQPRRSGTRTAPADRRPAAAASPARSMVAPVQARRRPGLQPPQPQPDAASGSRPDATAGRSPTRPAGQRSSPRWISPRRNVPVVRTTAPAAPCRPAWSHDPGDPPVDDQQVLDLALVQRRGSACAASRSRTARA